MPKFKVTLQAIPHSVTVDAVDSGNAAQDALDEVEQGSPLEWFVVNIKEEI